MLKAIKFNKVIFLFYIFICFIFSEIFNRSEIDKIDNCLEQIFAPSRYNQFVYDQLICIQCKLGYIVSKNYKQCIHSIDQLFYSQYVNCKRLADDGNCAEALDGIELLPNNFYTIVKDQKFFERCAIVNENESECLFPRFGFILDVKTKRIFKDTNMTFCALFDSLQQTCLKFQYRFIRWEDQNQQGVYLGEDFINPSKLANQSTAKNLYCQNDYFLGVKKLIQFEGCINEILKPLPDKNNCLFYQAFRDDKQKCEVVIPFCQEYMEIQEKKLCIKCFPFYKLHLQTCQRLKGCILTSNKNPNNCLVCNENYILSNKECIKRSKRILEKNNNFMQIKKGSSKSSYILRSKDLLHKESFLKSHQNFSKNLRMLNFEEKSQEIQDQNEDFDKLKKTHLLQEKDDQPIQQDQQCIYDYQNQCVQCISYSTYYLDVESNRCLIRERSTYCRYKIYNSDNCQNLFCDNMRFLNPELFQNFDLKNIETLEYINYLTDMHFEIDQILSDSEIKNLYKKYKFYGINPNLNSQFCMDIQLDQQQFLKIQYPTFILCATGIHQIELLKFPYLVFKCPDTFNFKNVYFDKCIQYDYEQSFCLECQKGFYFNSIEMSCLKKIENCLVHSKYQTCVICLSGYKLVEEIKCEPICGIAIPGTQIYFHSFYKYENAQVFCKKTDIPCKQFFNEKCIECFEGFVLDQSQDNTCLKDIYFPDCKVIDKYQQNSLSEKQETYKFEDKICIQCQEGYLLFGGLCFCQKASCLEYIFCNEIKCMKKFRSLFIGQLNLEHNQYLEKHGNFYKVLSCNITNCLMCYEGNICIKCMYGYYFNSEQQVCIDNWKKIIDNSETQNEDTSCLQLDTNTEKCQKCKTDYYLMLDFKCYKDCPPGYKILFSKKAGQICYQCPMGCKECTFLDSYLIFYPFRDFIYCNSCFYNDHFLYSDTQECKKICIYYEKQEDNLKKCVQNCTPQFLTDENKCSQSCPKFYKVIKDNYFCSETCKGYYIYEDNQLKCTDKCRQGYFQNEVQLLCQKCQDEKCIDCQQISPNYCAICTIPYKSINGACKIVCSNLLLVNDELECQNDIEIPYCIKQKEGKCLKCLDNYEYDEQKNQCYCNSLETHFDLLISTCYKYCDDNCQVCKQFQCIQCKPNTFQIQIHNRNLCIQKCPIGYYVKDSIVSVDKKLCIKCPSQCLSCINNHICLKCDIGYRQFACNNSLNSVYCVGDDLLYSKPISQQIQCQLCAVLKCIKCLQNKYVCEQCQLDYPFLYLNSCLQNCPDGTYSDDLYQCQKCHALCQTCSNKFSTSCITCKIPYNLQDQDGSCKCANRYFLFENQCYSSCPRFTKVIDYDNRLCQELCIEDKSYPVFNDDGVFENCESNLNLLDSKFCEQNLINLDKYITIQIQNTSMNGQNKNILIIITVSQTPKECYDFELKINPEIQESSQNLQFKEYHVQNKFNFQFKLQTEIEIKKVQQQDINKCKLNMCTLFLQIYYQSVLKKKIKFVVNLKSSEVQIKFVQLASLTYLFQRVFKTYQFEERQILDSVMYVYCQEDYIVCSNKSIIAFTSSSIIFQISILFDERRKINQKMILIPIKVYLVKQDETQSQIEEFFYYNQNPSQIKIEINFNQNFEGKLIMLFKASEQQNYHLGFEQFAQKNKQNFYIKQGLDLKIQNNLSSTEKIQKDNLGIVNIYEILYPLNILVCLLMILFTFITVILRRFHIKTKRYQYQNHEISSFQMAQNVSNVENQEQE